MKAVIELIVFYTHIVNYFMYVIIKYALRFASKRVGYIIKERYNLYRYIKLKKSLFGCDYIFLLVSNKIPTEIG